MARVENWWPALQAVVKEYEPQPFKWGRTDCAHFAADCVRAITGREVLGTIRNNYHSRLTAAARLRALKYRDIEDMVEAVFKRENWPEGIPACSQTGDVGITINGILCVRFPVGFIARCESGEFAKVVPIRSYCVAWD